MRRKILSSVLLALVLTALIGTSCFAQNTPFYGNCEYKNGSITADFDNKTFAATLTNLEPGDSVDYTITYKNGDSATTLWYMKNSVLETLEDNKNVAENGGYTYILTNVGPDGKKTVLFDNSEVGGEAKVANLEGLKQATNATGQYFFIQKLTAGQSGKTLLHVEFDGETEVNDYMDTAGRLMVAYAVEKDGTKTKTIERKTGTPVKTGDEGGFKVYYILAVAAAVVLILCIFSWRRDRRKGGERR